MNDEAQMSENCTIEPESFRISSFEFPSSFVIRISSFFSKQNRETRFRFVSRFEDRLSISP